MIAKKAKYQIIKEYVLESISEKAYLVDNPIPSEYDFCRIFNVSRSVVRRAIDELVIKGYLYRIQGKGTYVSKQNLIERNKSKNNEIPIILPNFDNYAIRSFIATLEKELIKKGFSTVFHQTFDDQSLEEKLLKQLKQYDYPGYVIYTSTVPDDQKKITPYIDLHSPIIFIDRYIENWPFDAIVGDEIKAGHTAVDHLYSVHRLKEIGFFGTEFYPVSAVRERLIGVKKAIKEFGFKYEEKRFYSTLNFKDDSRKKSPKEGATQLVKKYLEENPTLEAVIVVNDILAANLYSVCESLGIKIPDELSIISFMNDEYAGCLSPLLTTFDLNTKLSGKESVLRLLQRINNKNTLERKIIRIPYNLVIRESCGCKI